MSERWDVLVVDDEPVVRDAIRLILRDDGLSVATVEDAESALGHPALATCRLVICDMMLPGLPGIEAARAFRRQRHALPILFITGDATAGTEAQAADAGATAFLAKPFDDTELLTLVRHALEPTDVAGKKGRP
jgi:DNA-binding NtrC family response regulator